MDSEHALDKDCEHDLSEYQLISQSGIVFCQYECKKCYGIIYHLVGERLQPDKNDITQLFKIKVSNN